VLALGYRKKKIKMIKKATLERKEPKKEKKRWRQQKNCLGFTES
jgi:hypothetical protein